MTRHQTKRSQFDALMREELDSFKREGAANPRKAALDCINNIRVDATIILQSQLQVGRRQLVLRAARSRQAGEFSTDLKTLPHAERRRSPHAVRSKIYYLAVKGKSAFRHRPHSQGPRYAVLE